MTYFGLVMVPHVYNDSLFIAGQCIEFFSIDMDTSIRNIEASIIQTIRNYLFFDLDR